MSDTITTLQKMETLEAQQINLGIYNTRLTGADLQQELQKSYEALSEDQVQQALQALLAEGEIIEWQPGYYRSRIAETVRNLRLLRQRLWWQDRLSDAPLLTEDIRVEFRQRQRPMRDDVQVKDALPLSLPSEIAQAFRQAIGFETLSSFQKRALEQVFERSQHGNTDNESFIIAGDTGAGKTEAFLFPILLDIAIEPPELRQQPGARAVLVYPRIRLARNQLRRILRYTNRFHAEGGPRITLGIQNGDVPGNLQALREQWDSEERNNLVWHKVNLIENCTACDTGHYWVAVDDPGIESSCPKLVCDQCGHIIDSLHITQAALTANAPDLLIITDVSLSQWLAREKYSHLWGLWQSNFVTVPPRFLVLDEVHLYEQLKGAHIARLIKRFQARVRLVYRQTGEADRHAVIIGVSATLHDEQRFLAKLMDVDPQDAQQYTQLKVIKPQPDELEPTNGRERYIFIYPRRLSPTPGAPQYRVNDQAAAIQIVMCAMHNLKTDIEWRGLAFFDSINDLRQFRHNYDADPALQWIVGRDPTGREIPPANQDELWRIRTDRHKANGYTFNTCGSTCEDRIQNGTLHQCPHFIAGDCWTLARLFGWNQLLRVASSVYAGAEPQATTLDNRDLIPTSPSLEVGYDDDAIQLVYQHKAPPNSASFIQRRGRAGRDPDASPIIITLLWPYRRDDAFYFFRPEALYDPAFDDVPLNAGNFNVQRTHTLLAFFDLLACLRRQNLEGIRDDPRILDFTQAGWEDFASTNIQSFQWLDDPNRPGHKRVVIKHLETKGNIWISGKPVETGWVKEANGRLLIKGWLAMEQDLTRRVLQPAWERINQQDLFSRYLALAGIASRPYQTHYTYPFLVPLRGSQPRIIRQFGEKAWHSSQDAIERSNWVKTFRHIDWMLQGSEEATTLSIHYPNPDLGQPGHDDEPDERTLDVTFGLIELLPGNVSYRLREKRAIHWTPIPHNGESTFLYPLESVVDEETGQLTSETRPISEYQPILGDITSQPDSIFGVPRYLDEEFPGLPFMQIKRLRVTNFGSPNQQYSPTWYFLPESDDSQEGHSIALSAGTRPPQGALQISRRSTARASSVIVPYIAGDRRIAHKQLSSPLDQVFGSIDGFLEEGGGLLGYTRVFYEMQIDVKTPRIDGQSTSRTLRRRFFPPEPELDEAGQPKPILVGYAIETQGIRFQVNPDLLAQTMTTVLEDESLRLHLRHNFAIYEMAQYADNWDEFIQSLLEKTAVTIDYWLHEVIPQSQGEPRLLDESNDRERLLNYFQHHRIVRQAEVEEFREFLHRIPVFFDRLNDALQVAFQDTAGFQDFVYSVILHSFSALLKNLLARLGGVGSDDLVAYADLPILRNVDRTVDPRILIMDTVEGGSGGIAQAFERLPLINTDGSFNEEGSLWWTLQTELGHCPIAGGEALVETVLTQATPEQIEAVQNEQTAEAINDLLTALDLNNPITEAISALGRILFNQTEMGEEIINPALLLGELFQIQANLNQQVPGKFSRKAVVQHAVENLNPANQPNIVRLHQALRTSGVSPDELEHELALQLFALFNASCEDGCPVCLSATSDVEHYYLAPLLNSRRVLQKLRQTMLTSATQGDCLAALADTLLAEETVQVHTNPGDLGNRLDLSLGLGTVEEVDETGQVCGGTTVVADVESARAFLTESDSWEERYGEGRRIETPDGNRVRSRAEYIIATSLYHEGIAYQYEPPFPYRDENGRTRYIHPDFYLYEHNLYIEYWGRDDPEYIESRHFKEQVYAQRDIEPVHIEKDEVDSPAFLEKIKARIADLPDSII